MEDSAIYSVDAEFSCGGVKCKVATFDIFWEINGIPTAVVEIPLTTMSGGNGSHGAVVIAEDDATKAGDGTLGEIMSSYMKEASLSVYVEKKSGESGTGSKIDVSGWLVTNVGIQAQNRVSPGGVVVVLQKDTCKLKQRGGFFYVGGLDISEAILSGAPGNIVAIGDTVLDRISEAMRATDTGERSWNDISDEDMSVKISDYIDPGGLGLPFYGLFSQISSGDTIAKALRLEIAKEFIDMHSRSVYDALLGLGSVLGYAICPSLGKDKDRLVALDPWKDRSDAKKVSGNSVFETSLTPDSDKIGGVRIFAGQRDVMQISTMCGKKPIDTDKDMVSDTMFFYSSDGRIINMPLPSFLSEAIGEAVRLSSTPSSDAVSTYDTKNNQMPTDQAVDPEKMLDAVSGSSDDAASTMADIRNAVAETVFAINYKFRQRLEITSPLIANDFPKIGSTVSTDVGTGGVTVSGIVVRNRIRGSARNGTCYAVTTAAYAGSAPFIKHSEEDEGPPRNKIWQT